MKLQPLGVASRCCGTPFAATVLPSCHVCSGAGYPNSSSRGCVHETEGPNFNEQIKRMGFLNILSACLDLHSGSCCYFGMCCCSLWARSATTEWSQLVIFLHNCLLTKCCVFFLRCKTVVGFNIYLQGGEGGGKKARNKHFLFLFGMGFCLFLALPPCSFRKQDRTRSGRKWKKSTQITFDLRKEILLLNCLLFLFKNCQWLLGKRILVKSEVRRTPAPIKELMSRIFLL